MSAEDEPHAARMARLLVSPAEVVFEDLKASDSSWLTKVHDEELEIALAARKHPLIDMALARYGTTPSVVASLYSLGLNDTEDETHSRGIRVSCYANQRLDVFMSGLLKELTSPEQGAIVIAGADIGELAVLMKNPTIGDDALADLFLGAGAFAGLPEERWTTLVQLAAQNPRIARPGDEQEGPDWGFWKIHKALFQLVKAAPVTAPWAQALHAILAATAPPSVAADEPITATLAKWSSFEMHDHKGNAREGYYTNLSFAEEFRCLLASTYGTRLIDSAYQHAGAANSSTLPERCAYYAGAKLTKPDVQRFSAADGAGFGLAFMFNESAILTRETREAFDVYGRFDRDLYRTRVGLLAKSWPFLQDVVAGWEGEGKSVSPATSEDVHRLGVRVDELQKQLRAAGWVLMVALAVIAYFARH